MIDDDDDNDDRNDDDKEEEEEEELKYNKRFKSDKVDKNASYGRFLLKFNPFRECNGDFKGPTKNLPQLLETNEGSDEGSQYSDAAETLFFCDIVEVKVRIPGSKRRKTVLKFQLSCLCGYDLILGSRNKKDDVIYCDLCAERIPAAEDFLFCSNGL